MLTKNKTGRTPLEVDQYLRELSTENRNYDRFKNSSIHSIRRVEIYLNKLISPISYKCLIEEKNIDDKYLKWYLAWECDKSSKNYGLNLICEQVNENNNVIDVSKESFIICDANLRAKYSKYLIFFIKEFTNHLISLQSDEYDTK
jgi:hypothetical protein